MDRLVDYESRMSTSVSLKVRLTIDMLKLMSCLSVSRSFGTALDGAQGRRGALVERSSTTLSSCLFCTSTT